MVKLHSINRDLDWRQVLPLLKVPTTEQPMPMVAECPLCRKPRMKVFDDRRLGGNWYYCQDCKSSGDMIALASRTWNTSIYETVKRLADFGCDIPETACHNSAIAKYMKNFTGLQEECRRLCVDSSKLLHRGQVDVGYVMQQAGLPQDYEKTYWPRRMGRFTGAANRLRVLQALLCAPGEPSYGKLKHGYIHLSGKGWRDVIVLPFHSLPGQISGFLFIGRRGRGSADQAFHILNPAMQDYEESGLFMYEVMDTPTAYAEMLQDDVFVFNDPVLALRLQSRHLRESDLPLPLVSSYHAKAKRPQGKSTYTLSPDSVWQHRPDKKFIFWSATVSADVFNSAARADGRVWISKYPEKSSRNRTPIGWLTHARKKARHWMIALEAHLQELPEDTAITLVNELRISSDQMKKFRDRCCVPVRRLLDSNRHRVKLLSAVRVNGKQIMESEGGWFITGKNEECVSNAIIRIEKVLCSADEDMDPIYFGRVLFDGEEYEFQEPLSKLEKAPGTWLKKKMLAQAGKLVAVRNGWNLHLLDIARHFHEPEVIREDGKFGWKSNDSCFAFPKFSVHLGGEVSVETAHVVDERAPGMVFEDPATTPDLAPLLADTPSNQLFWAATTCIASMSISQAVGQGKVGLGLVGPGALLIGRATARAAGCFEFMSCHADSKRDNMARNIQATLEKHDWPLLIRAEGDGVSLSALNTWYNGDYDRNAVVYMRSEIQAALIASLGPWRFIREERAIEPGPEIREYGRHVLPVWLQWMCRKRLDVHGELPYIQRISNTLIELMGCYGDPAVVAKGYELIDRGSDCEVHRASQFARLLWTLIDEGALKFVHVSDAGGVKVPKIVLTDGHVFVGHDTLGSLLASRKLVIPDRRKIDGVLQTADAFAGQSEYNGETGWLLSENWWSKQVDFFRTPRLSIPGGA